MEHMELRSWMACERNLARVYVEVDVDAQLEAAKQPIRTTHFAHLSNPTKTTTASTSTRVIAQMGLAERAMPQ